MTTPLGKSVIDDDPAGGTRAQGFYGPSGGRVSDHPPTVPPGARFPDPERAAPPQCANIGSNQRMVREPGRITGSPSGKVKVMHVTESMSTGVLDVIRAICESLSDDVEFVILHSRRPETPANVQELFPSNVVLKTWNAVREVSPRRDWSAIRALRQSVAEFKPDLIHAHSSKAGALARLSFPFGGVPVCYSPHGYSFLRRDISLPMRTLYRWAEWLLGRTPTVTVAVGLGEYALASATSRRALMISNTVGLPACYRPIADRVKVRPLQVVTAGRICPQKNFPLFCEIAAALLDEPVRFTWIGSGELPPGSKVPSNMTVTGWLERTAALELMAKAHIYLQTSLWEGLPITLLEASSLGLPILAKPCVGNLEMVLEGENGFTCDRREDFVDRILALGAAPDQLIRLGTASRKLAEGGYVREGAVPRWRSLYNHIERYRRFG